MKTILRLAVLALAGTAALALAGNALATQKLSVRQTATSLTIKLSQASPSPAPGDPQPAKIQIYVPTGYTINASQAAGTKIGTTTGTVYARDQNIPLPLSGDVVAVPPTTNAPGCDPVAHLAVWNLALSVAGQTINLPVHVDQTTGTETALGAYKLVVCLGPSDVPQGTPGRSAFGAQLIDATFAVENVFTVPTGQSVWKALTTPWAAGVPAPNPAGTVETRAIVGSGAVSLVGRVRSKARRTMTFSGTVTQAGAGVAGQTVTLLVNGKARFRSKRTSATGAYSVTLKAVGKRKTSTFQARVTVAERDVTASGCASPTPGVPGGCVSATASGFSAVSRKVTVRL